MFCEESNLVAGPSAFGADGQFEFRQVGFGRRERCLDTLAQRGLAFVFRKQNLLRGGRLLT